MNDCPDCQRLPVLCDVPDLLQELGGSGDSRQSLVFVVFLVWCLVGEASPVLYVACQTPESK